MENKVLVLGVCSAVVLLGGLALLWGKKKKEKEPIEEEPVGEEANADDPLTTIILWYEGKLFFVF